MPIAKDLRLKKGYPSYAQYQKIFGSLNIGLKAAGFSLNKFDGLSDEEYLKILERLYKNLGREPMAKDLGSHNGTPHYDSYRNKFGSLNTALSKIGVSAEKINWTKEELFQILTEFYKNLRVA